MTGYLITVLILLFLMAFEYKKYQHPLCPTVIYPLFWMLSLLGLTVGDLYFDVSFYMLTTIIVGYVLFCIGFRKVSSGVRLSRNMPFMNDVRINKIGYSLAFWMSLIIGLYYIYIIRRYIPFNNFTQDIFFRLLQNKSTEEIEIPVYLSYIAGIIRCTLLISLMLVYRYDRYHENDLLYRGVCICRFWVLLLLSIIIVFTNFSRNGVLSLLMPLIFIVFIGKKSTPVMIIRSSAIVLLVFLAFFAWFSTFRDAYLYDGSNFWEVLKNSFSLYLSGAIVAMDQVINNNLVDLVRLGDGNYTFCFITGIFDRIFGTHTTPQVVLDSIRIGIDQTTNVYTVYYWTSLDFGLLYSIFIQFVLGLFYGYLYKGIANGRSSSLIWYSQFTYPLVIMFFADQFFSIGPTWFVKFVDYLIVYFVVFKRKKV